MNEGAQTQDLDPIAGLSRTPPAGAYVAEGLSFGSARLERDTERHWTWQRLVLSLTPAAAASAGQTGSAASSIDLALHLRADLTVEPGALAGLRELLVVHRLLSRPELLRGRRTEDVPAGSPAARVLGLLASQLVERTTKPTFAYAEEECSRCRALRAEAERATKEAALKAAEAAVGTARSNAEARRMQQEVSWKRAALVNTRDLSRRTEPCPHMAMKYEALATLCRRFPELAFEATGLLQAAGALDPPRFVIHTEAFKSALGHWLLGRARSRYDDWGASYSRLRHRRTYSATKSRAREATTLPPEQRAGVTFAASAWGFPGEIGALGWDPATTLEGDVSIDERPSVEEPLSVSAILPEGCVEAPKAKAPVVATSPARRARTSKSTTTGAAQKAAPTPKSGPAAKVPAVSAPAVAEAPTGELMASELKAMGHTPADVKRMLADGVLERAGFGWYRFTRRG